MTQARTYPFGVTSWIDVEQPDVEAAAAFYAGLLGWTFTTATPPESPFRYLVAQLDGQDVAGLGGPAQGGRAEPSGSPTSPTWHTYVAVDDIDASVAAVGRAGGRVVSPPATAGEGGVAASCTDPDGADFRLWQAHRRLGAQVTNVPGAWNFSDLHAADPPAAASFYAEVFGWELEDLGFATMIRVPGYGDHLAATVDPGIHERQSAIDAPPGFADAVAWLAPSGELGPGWHVTFAVADRDETAALTQALGGHVVRRSDTDWTRTAVITDPQGATFTASQFTPPGDG
jgi:predicted enzyme related to lactoylglutathione lyase